MKNFINLSVMSKPKNHICPMCQQEMNDWAKCGPCGIIYWPKESVQHQIDRRGVDAAESEWSQISLPVDQSYYFFVEHDKFYTIPEMQRLAKLKAFL
jgi:hypothetical protein